MKVGSIDVPMTETSWTTWTWNITQEDLEWAKAKDFPEFLTKVRNGEVDLFDMDVFDISSLDSEIEESHYDEATGFDFQTKKYYKAVESTEHDSGDEDPKAWNGE